MTTGPKSANDIRGFEFDWLARDADDHVGFFSTAGGGYAPREFLQDTDAHEVAIDAILSLPASTTARFAIELPPEFTNTWRLMAERGLFAYDSNPNGGPYHLQAAPDTPILVTELPAAVVSVLAALHYPDLQFARCTTIFTESLLRQ